ncbi:MAG: ABC transporter ATP-binding protein [Candidatus Thiodiazotropha sp.]
MSNRTVIDVSALCMRFAKRRLLDGIDLSLERGECVLLTGGNGAGKTTLLRILAGLERPDSCCISIADENPRSWRRCRSDLHKRILYLHQHPYMFDGSVRYNLGYALPRGLNKQTRQRLVDSAIDWAELGYLQETPAKSLSGGERQRVSLARARLRNPRILLLDEPTANLDQTARQRTLDLLNSFKEQGIALLLASHDPLHFTALIDRHIHLYEGRLIGIEEEKLMSIQSQKSNGLRSTA